MTMIDPQTVQEWKEFYTKFPQRMEDEQNVIKSFGKIFHPRNLDKLTKEEFKSFLLFKNNKHWDGIHRQSNMITADMPKLIKTLKLLLDESQSIKERLDILFPPKGNNMIKGLGRAIVTPILMVVYPSKYGVFNTKTEEGLKTINLLPDLRRKSFAEKYLTINDILTSVAKEHSMSLWQVDDLFGWIIMNDSTFELQASNDEIPTPQDSGIENYNDFGLEAHLEEFLIENWEKLSLGRKYDILVEDGDIVGQQYITPVGRMDILTKSKDGKEILVIELKKGRSSDAVVGQTLRYIGWLGEHMAEPGQKVKGLIIVGENDEKLKYSLKTVPNIDLQIYEVSFKLKKPV
ncbi:MAG: endonuclease NucS domain-containing protein [Patescibacteria group bacterium]